MCPRHSAGVVLVHSSQLAGQSCAHRSGVLMCALQFTHQSTHQSCQPHTAAACNKYACCHHGVWCLSGCVAPAGCAAKQARKAGKPAHSHIPLQPLKSVCLLQSNGRQAWSHSVIGRLQTNGALAVCHAYIVAGDHNTTGVGSIPHSGQKQRTCGVAHTCTGSCVLSEQYWAYVGEKARGCRAHGVHITPHSPCNSSNAPLTLTAHTRQGCAPCMKRTHVHTSPAQPNNTTTCPVHNTGTVTTKAQASLAHTARAQATRTATSSGLTSPRKSRFIISVLSVRVC